MRLADVMDALGAALDTIAGLRATPYYADSVTPPAAVVAWPDSYDYDQTMQRGSDSVSFPVVCVVGRADARTTRDQLSEYANGSGALSVKAAIEDYVTDVWDSARVTKAEFGSVSIAGTSYLSATFIVEIYAPGEVT